MGSEWCRLEDVPAGVVRVRGVHSQPAAYLVGMYHVRPGAWGALLIPCPPLPPFFPP